MTPTQKEALYCVTKRPGSTQQELDHCFPDPTDVRARGRRLNELEKMGKVRTGKKRVCTVSGARCKTYYPVSKDDEPAKAEPKLFD